MIYNVSIGVIGDHFVPILVLGISYPIAYNTTGKLFPKGGDKLKMSFVHWGIRIPITAAIIGSVTVALWFNPFKGEGYWNNLKHNMILTFYTLGILFLASLFVKFYFWYKSQTKID